MLYKQKTTNGNITPQKPKNLNISTVTLPNTGSESLSIGCVLFALGSLFIIGTILFRKNIGLISNDLNTN